MKTNTVLSWSQVIVRLDDMAKAIQKLFSEATQKEIAVYGIPRAGAIVVGLLTARFPRFREAIYPETAHVIVDDIIDSGATRDQFTRAHGKPIYALVDKQNAEDRNIGWVVFPWEGDSASGVRDNVLRILQHLGEDPKRDGLRETPDRVIRSWATLYGGYNQNAADVFKVFENPGYDQMVISGPIEFYSTCEHHMLPFFGTARIAYLPGAKVVGISKLSRLVDIFARRLQIQERLTNQIAQAIQEHLNPQGVGVVIEAKHFCMMARGVQKQHPEMITSALLGKFLQQEVRQEFFTLSKLGKQ